MPQSTRLVQTLKKTLKAHGLTYADISVVLDLSEASVKRLFSEENFTLNRLDRICQMMNLDISDLVQLMNEDKNSLQQLSVEQEKEITQDLVLLLVTVCVLNKWSMEEIVAYYKITDTECIQKLARLDKLKIIDLLPNNRIKLRVASEFSWLENGPIQMFFQQTIGQEYIKSRFTRDDECLMVLNGMLSIQSNGEFQRKLRRLAREFADLNNDDASLELGKRKGVTVVLAMRGWHYGLFRPLIRV